MNEPIVFLKKLVLKLFLFLLVYTLVIECFFLLAPTNLEFQVFKQDWIRAKKRVDQSYKKISKDTLYVGDSVGGQLRPYNNDNQLTTNGSTLAIGNYFLIKNAIEKNEHIKTVIYLSTPTILGNKLARSSTFYNVVKPFFTLDHKEEILSSENVKTILEKNKFLPFCLFNSIKVLKINDFNYENGQPKSPDTLSIESIEWLGKMASICKERNVNFHIASPPIAKSKRKKYSNWKAMRNQVIGTNLEELFITYFETINYVEDKYLRDKIHWKKEFMNKNREDLMKFILNKLDKPQVAQNKKN